MKRCCLTVLYLLIIIKGFCWGFYGHRIINYYAVFLLPPEMIAFYKPNIDFISNHAVNPDKRRYAVTDEGPRHYIDMDRFKGENIPPSWSKAVEKFGEDTLKAYGIAPWWIQIMIKRLTIAFREKNMTAILKISAETGHYIGDVHVPLHTSSNHNGQLTNQQGIHGFWESRIPEMFAEEKWDLFTGRAVYIKNTLEFTWACILESSKASDSVLSLEKKLDSNFPSDRKYAYENRNGKIIRQYSGEYVTQYNDMLNGMVERRLRQSIFAVASIWYTAWVNAGQPDLKKLVSTDFTEEEKMEFNEMENKWKNGNIKGRSCE